MLALLGDGEPPAPKMTEQLELSFGESKKGDEVG